ncbi:ricin-type beta-trefoil lectin domain protein [Streptomyces xanthophaeus]
MGGARSPGRGPGHRQPARPRERPLRGRLLAERPSAGPTDLSTARTGPRPEHHPDTRDIRPRGHPGAVTRPALLSPRPARPARPGRKPATTRRTTGLPLHRTLRNVTTGKCLDIATGGIPNQGSKITQFDCGAPSGHQQAFDLVDGTDGLLIRSSAQPALCFDLPDYGAPTKAYVGLYPCQNTTADNQLWYRKWNADQSAFLLVNVKSDQAGRPMCLDVDDYSVKTNGQRVGIAPCNSTTNDDHWWTLP